MATQSERSETGKGGNIAECSPSRTMGDTRVDPNTLPEDTAKRMSGQRDGMSEYAAGYVEEKPPVKSKETSKGVQGIPTGATAPCPGSRLAAGHLSRRSLKDPDGASAPSPPAAMVVDQTLESDPLVSPKGKSQDLQMKSKTSQEPSRQKITRNEKQTKPGLDHTSIPNIPDTNIAVACLVTLCFNLPLGAVAIYFSLMAAKAYRDGQTKKGAKRTRISIYISLFSIVLTVLIVMTIVLLMTMTGQTGQSRRRLSKTTIVL